MNQVIDVPPGTIVPTNTHRKKVQGFGESIDKRSQTPKAHLSEYLMEGAGLGIFMISACLFSVALFHTDSLIVTAIPERETRLLLMSIAMGLTAIGIIYSPWGKQSGAHLNPAVTLTFYHLGRITWRDAGCYIVAQLVGGLAGVLLLTPWMASALADSNVIFAATVPGHAGVAAAWFAEFTISFLLMMAVLIVSNQKSIARMTGVVAGMIVAANIYFAAPLSGMSMNPARTLASAIPSGIWTSIWVYFSAPILAMLMAGRCYVWIAGRQAIFCAKLHHQNSRRCIFCESRTVNQ